MGSVAKLFSPMTVAIACLGCACASAHAAEGTVPDTPAARQARETAPQLFSYTQNVLFGDLWKRPDLKPRDRSLVTMSALVANGQAAQMTSHINLGLDNGLKASEIVGLITHLAFYTGWPNAMSSVGVAGDAFKKRNIDIPKSAAPSKLLPVDKDTEERRAAQVDGGVGATAPALARYTNEVLFDDMWRQPDLSKRDRSLVTIAALIARGHTDQLRAHVARGMDHGLTAAELREAVTHLAFYAGWPRAMSALPMLKAEFDLRTPK